MAGRRGGCGGMEGWGEAERGEREGTGAIEKQAGYVMCAYYQ